MKQEELRKLRYEKMLVIIHNNESASVKNIIARFCLSTGLRREKALEFFNILKDAQRLEVDNELVFLPIPKNPSHDVTKLQQDEPSESAPQPNTELVRDVPKE